LVSISTSLGKDVADPEDLSSLEDLSSSMDMVAVKEA